MNKGKYYSIAFVILIISLSACLTEEIPLYAEDYPVKYQTHPQETVLKQWETLNIIPAQIYIYIDRVTEYSEINKSVRMLITLPDGFVQTVELNTNRNPQKYYLNDYGWKYIILKDVKLVDNEYLIIIEYNEKGRC